MIRIRILFLTGLAILINNTAFSSITLEPGDTIQKLISLEFNNAANEPDREEYLDFLLSYDTTSFNVISNPFFEIRNKVLKVRATEYDEKVKRNGLEGILVSFTPKLGSEQGKSHNIKIKLLENSVSSGLEGNIDKGTQGDLITEFNEVTYYVPMSTLTTSIIIISVTLLIFAICWFVLTRDNRLFGKKTFKHGLLTFPDGELSTVRLERENRFQFDISKALGVDDGIILIPYDKFDFVTKSKKRFARLKNTSTASLTIFHEATEETMGVTHDLYNFDEIKIKTANGDFYNIIYNNNKRDRVNT